ncbi:Glutathione S-transferase DHAR3, chloroplastic [Triticum urartu]|uniref:Glutathione S-transferase DHAR3, chloroplastic n=1 Tax=Triticum urartu TaxID=4572 RepID=M7ZN76_TRIUA|nr:Glutathione S-transferase DHAR3, chloroplastic [Triticum urartu]
MGSKCFTPHTEKPRREASGDGDARAIRRKRTYHVLQKVPLPVISDKPRSCLEFFENVDDDSGPFTQRVLLTIEEKNLPYELKLVDLANKPDWLFTINPEGKVPIVKLEDKWIADSDVITQVLEEKYPQPSLATPPEKASIGSKIFSTFVGFLKSKDTNDGTEQTLLSELTSFDSYLKDNGPFINGGTISAADLSLAPKLYHMEIALGHYKNWSVPDALAHVKTYMKTIFSMDSFVNTRGLPEDVIAGWRSKVMG